MPIKAVIFDLDGVICSTDEFHYQAWKALARELGLPFNRKKNQRLRGVSRMASLEIVLEGSRVPYTGEQKQLLADEKNARYRQLLQKLSPEAVMPGVAEAIVALRRAGLKLAIGSSSKNTKMILSRLGLSDAFDAVADGTDILKSKPDPEVFLCAAKKLKVAPECCAVVEDALAGLQAAKAAGMRAIAYGAAEDAETIADAVLQSHTQLIELLEKLS